MFLLFWTATLADLKSTVTIVVTRRVSLLIQMKIENLLIRILWASNNSELIKTQKYPFICKAPKSRNNWFSFPPYSTGCKILPSIKAKGTWFHRHRYSLTDDYNSSIMLNELHPILWLLALIVKWVWLWLWWKRAKKILQILIMWSQDTHYTLVAMRLDFDHATVGNASTICTMLNSSPLIFFFLNSILAKWYWNIFIKLS